MIEVDILGAVAAAAQRILGEVSIWGAVAAAVALFFGSFVFSATGFGIGMIATPILLLAYEPLTTIVVTGTAGMGVGVWIFTKSWRDIPMRVVLPIALAAVIGSPISVIILRNADAGLLTIGIAALIILFAIGSFVKVEREIPYSTPIGIAAGFIVGVLLPTTGVAGSLVMLYFMTRQWERLQVRAAMAFFLLVLMTASVIQWAIAGFYTHERLTLLGIAVIPSIAGLALGAMLVRRLNESVFQYLVIGIIIASSVLVIGQELLKLV